MSTIFQIEVFKICRRRNLVLALLITGLLLTVTISALSYLHAVEDKVPEGLFIDHTAWAIISYSHLYFFLPVLIIVFTGQELREGFVNRVAFLKGRKYFFLSKMVYAFLIAVAFSVFGSIALILSIAISPYPSLDLAMLFLLKFFSQALITNLSFGLFLTGLVFLVRSPLVCFVLFFVLETVEKILFILADKILHAKLFFMPLHSLRLFYSRNGDSGMENYFMLFDEFSSSYFLPILTVAGLLGIAYWQFQKRDLPVISD